MANIAGDESWLEVDPSYTSNEKDGDGCAKASAHSLYNKAVYKFFLDAEP